MCMQVLVSRDLWAPGGGHPANEKKYILTCVLQALLILLHKIYINVSLIVYLLLICKVIIFLCMMYHYKAFIVMIILVIVLMFLVCYHIPCHIAYDIICVYHLSEIILIPYSKCFSVFKLWSSLCIKAINIRDFLRFAYCIYSYRTFKYRLIFAYLLSTPMCETPNLIIVNIINQCTSCVNVTQTIFKTARSIQYKN